MQAKGACRREGPNERAIGFGIGVLPAQVPSGKHARRMHPLLAKKVSLVPTPEGAEIRYAVLPVHINMLIFRSSQLDGEINAG